MITFKGPRVKLYRKIKPGARLGQRFVIEINFIYRYLVAKIFFLLHPRNPSQLKYFYHIIPLLRHNFINSFITVESNLQRKMQDALQLNVKCYQAFDSSFYRLAYTAVVSL